MLLFTVTNNKLPKLRLKQTLIFGYNNVPKKGNIIIKLYRKALHEALYKALYKALHKALHKTLHEALHEVLYEAVDRKTRVIRINNKNSVF